MRATYTDYSHRCDITYTDPDGVRHARVFITQPHRFNPHIYEWTSGAGRIVGIAKAGLVSPARRTRCLRLLSGENLGAVIRREFAKLRASWRAQKPMADIALAQALLKLEVATDALRAVEARHVEANARVGRPEQLSGTLGIVRAALAKIGAA